LSTNCLQVDWKAVAQKAGYPTVNAAQVRFRKMQKRCQQSESESGPAPREEISWKPSEAAKNMRIRAAWENALGDLPEAAVQLPASANPQHGFVNTTFTLQHRPKAHEANVHEVEASTNDEQKGGD